MVHNKKNKINSVYYDKNGCMTLYYFIKILLNDFVTQIHHFDEY